MYVVGDNDVSSRVNSPAKPTLLMQNILSMLRLEEQRRVNGTQVVKQDVAATVKSPDQPRPRSNSIPPTSTPRVSDIDHERSFSELVDYNSQELDFLMLLSYLSQNAHKSEKFDGQVSVEFWGKALDQKFRFVKHIQTDKEVVDLFDSIPVDKTFHEKIAIHRKNDENSNLISSMLQTFYDNPLFFDLHIPKIKMDTAADATGSSSSSSSALNTTLNMDVAGIQDDLAELLQPVGVLMGNSTPASVETSEEIYKKIVNAYFRQENYVSTQGQCKAFLDGTGPFPKFADSLKPYSPTSTGSLTKSCFTGEQLTQLQTGWDQAMLDAIQTANIALVNQIGIWYTAALGSCQTTLQKLAGDLPPTERSAILKNAKKEASEKALTLRNKAKKNRDDHLRRQEEQQQQRDAARLAQQQQLAQQQPASQQQQQQQPPLIPQTSGQIPSSSGPIRRGHGGARGYRGNRGHRGMGRGNYRGRGQNWNF